jgi:hypothetical protein
MQNNQDFFPDLGFGLGLRIPHYSYIFEHWPQVDWFEIISENFIDTEGKPRRNLARIREHYPIVMHGVSLSIGTTDPLNFSYLDQLKKFANFIEPAWISDHLCWTGIAHKNTHDLLPLPYTEESLRHLVTRIKQVQDYLERPIALENPSTYLEFNSSQIPEAEFIAQMVAESGCSLLLDVNNVYVSCYNHRLDPKLYIDKLPLESVAQIHLSGHRNMGTHIIDTHDAHVIDEVFSLYRYVIHNAKRLINTMVEWDDNIPDFPVLFAELNKVKTAALSAENYSPLPQINLGNSSYIANVETTLADAQNTMQKAIFQGSVFESQPEDWILQKDNFSPSAQLNVYVEAYRSRLFDSVAEDYPQLKKYLGAEKFAEIISNFVEKNNSEHFNISRYSLKLPDFLSSTESVDKFAHELAMLESNILLVEDLPETKILQPEHLQKITAEDFMDLHISPRKALKLLEFSFPVNEFYSQFLADKLFEKPTPRKSFLAVFRHEDVVWRLSLAEKEYFLLKQIFSGHKISAAFSALMNDFPDLLEDEILQNISSWFARWIQNGLLAYDEEAKKQKVLYE